MLVAVTGGADTRCSTQGSLEASDYSVTRSLAKSRAVLHKLRVRRPRDAGPARGDPALNGGAVRKDGGRVGLK